MNTLINNNQVMFRKKLKELVVVGGLMSLGILGWGMITPVWGATITITFIDTQAAGGGTLYIDHANVISLEGTGAGNSNTVYIEVDGAEVQTTVSSVGGNFNCNFNAPDIDATQVVRAWVVAAQYTNEQNIIVDTDEPDIPAIVWENPTGTVVGWKLEKIYAAALNDTGGSEIDWTNSEITLNQGLNGSSSQDGSDLVFTPANGYPAATVSHNFQHNLLYTITATIYDKAGNVRINAGQFTYDNSAPTIAIHWESPPDQSQAGWDLSEIRAAVSDTVSGVDWGSSDISLDNGITGSSSQSGSDLMFVPTNGYPAVTGAHAFQHNILYTVTAQLVDQAGNTSLSTGQFRFDNVAPTIAIHWQHPLDGAYVGQNLNRIWAVINDSGPGNSGIDSVNSNITVSGVTGTKSYSSPDMDFIPNGNNFGPPNFNHNNTYTITTLIYDQVGNTNAVDASFDFDYVNPVVDVDWNNPAGSPPQNGTYVGPSLNRIWAPVSDTTPGDSGIDWSASILRVVEIAGGSSAQSGSDLEYTPPNPYVDDFSDDNLYTVRATIYDNAENQTIVEEQFRYDNRPPSVSIRWRYPYRTGSGVPDGASYYMGEDLSRIWAPLNPTVTEDVDFGEAIDYANTQITITPAPGGGSENQTYHLLDWLPFDEAYFTNGILYTVTVDIRDKAGNNASFNREFMKDENPPVIGNMQISDISAPEGVLNANNRVIRGTHFPLATDNFVAYITDTKGGSNDWGGNTSLNGSGISHHSYQPSEMRLYYEGSPLVEVNPFGTSNIYTVTSGTTYQGFLTLPGNYPPLSGVYSISVCARDWANYENSHQDTKLPRFLVDDIPPLEDGVFPTQSTESPNPPYIYFSLSGDKYLRSYDLINDAPRKVSVYAQDAPFDRNVSFPECTFPDRLNLMASSVTLLNPDNVEYTINSAAGWVRDGTDEVNTFEADIAQTISPIFPIPEYIGNTIEGRYTIRIHLEDTISNACGDPNTRDMDYYFINDLTPPRLISWDPFSAIPLPDTYTSNFPDVQVSLMDPDLRAPFSGGTVYPGSGLNLTACAVEIYSGVGEFWDKPEDGHIHADGPFIGPQNQSLSEEQITVFKLRDIDQQVREYYGWDESEYKRGRKSFVYVTTAMIAANGSIDVTGLTPMDTYVIGWRIPAAYNHDGLCVIGSLPNVAVVKDGFYFANCFAADMVGNTTQVESIYFHYYSAGGMITLTADPNIVPADGTSEAVITTSQIYLSNHPGTLVQQGTLITVSSSLGDIMTLDADTILEGIQVATGSDGRAVFTVRSRARESGIATLRAKSASGFADSGEVTNQLEFVLSKMYSGRMVVKPAMEAMTAEYQIEAHVNTLNALTAGIDEITIQFPAGTGLPAVISSGDLLLNHVPVSGSNITGRDLSFVIPVTMPKNSLFTVLFLETAGIINPAAGSYMLKIKSGQNYEFLDIPYNILISIRDEEIVPAPNPCSQDRVRFFFNLDGPARVELVMLNLLGDKVSCMTERYGAAKKGETLDWNTLPAGPGIYWALMKIHYDDGRTVSLKKRKVVIIK